MSETGRGRKEGDKAAAAADPVLDQRNSDLILGRSVVNAHRTSYSGADVYAHEALVAAMGETAAERNWYGAGGGSRPVLGLKPRRISEDERLVEMLDAMTRYVRAGKAVPREWREALDERLAWRDSGFSKQVMTDDIAAALARDGQAADVAEHLGCDAVRRALGDGAAEETRRDRGVFIDTSDLIDEDKATLKRVMESADRSGAMVADLIFHYLGEYFKLRPWEVYPEPAKPNVPQSEEDCN